MAYVDNFAHDLFISYAHLDDQPMAEERGWVSLLVDHLRSVLARRLGRADAFSVWMDHRIFASEPISNALIENLSRSATLLILMSPAYLRSNWCREEMSSFLASLQKSRQGERIFIAEMSPTDRREWPAALQDLVGIKFWRANERGVPHTIGSPRPDAREDSDYWQAVSELSHHIVQLLHKLKTHQGENNSALSVSVLNPPVSAAPSPSADPPHLTSELDSRRERGEYDVFLCHNMEDKPEVKLIASLLIQKGILPWLDEWDLRPGLPWEAALEGQIESIKSAAVFVGDSGFGPWQQLELSAFLREFSRRRCPVIPVLLQSCVAVPHLPTFLRGMHWVDFRCNDPDPLGRLMWGITGKRPRTAV